MSNLDENPDHDREQEDEQLEVSFMADVFEGMSLPGGFESVVGSDLVDIPLREQNVKLRYRGEQIDSPIIGDRGLDGKLELELQSTQGRVIDTVYISNLTEESLKSIVAAIAGPRLQLPFRGLSPLGKHSFLTQGKLKSILVVAGGEGAHIETPLGITPTDIADQYYKRFNKAIGEEDAHELSQSYRDTSATLSSLHHGFELARALGISKVLVPASAPAIVREVQRERRKESIIWILQDDAVPEDMLHQHHKDDVIYSSKNKSLHSKALQRLAMFSALARGSVEIDERVLCFTGADQSQHIVGSEIKLPGRVFTWITRDSLNSLQAIPNETFEVIEQVVNIALRFSLEGIEGKKMGATFVVGRPEELGEHLDQHILNPFKGHEEELRSVHSDRFLRTLRQFASNDGAVIVRPDGVATSASTYLVAPVDRIETREGWGARHVSAAAITSVTSSVSVVISESSGDVSVMWGGRPILELTKE